MAFEQRALATSITHRIPDKLQKYHTFTSVDGIIIIYESIYRYRWPSQCRQINPI